MKTEICRRISGGRVLHVLRRARQPGREKDKEQVRCRHRRGQNIWNR